AGVTLPKEALPHCIGAVVTDLNISNNVPGHNETLSGWIFQQARQNPAVVRSILSEMWVSSATLKKGSLPGFYELNRDPDSQQFLASLSADVLKTGINEDHDTV